MNQGQTMFHNFFIGMVKEGEEQNAEALLTECFKKQDDGTFDKEFFQGIMSKMFAMVRPECVEQLKEAMSNFGSQL